MVEDVRASITLGAFLRRREIRGGVDGVLPRGDEMYRGGIANVLVAEDADHVDFPCCCRRHWQTHDIVAPIRAQGANGTGIYSWGGGEGGGEHNRKGKLMKEQRTTEWLGRAC